MNDTRSETMPTVAELTRLCARLSGTETAGADTERVDLLATLETLKCACAAAQARVTVSFEASQRREQAAKGLPARKQGKGVASQVALARHESPVKGNRFLGLSRALVTEMPQTLAALAAGRINEWRATIIVRETATLSAVHRARVDAELAGRLDTLGDRGVEREARKIAYRLDPASALRRARTARSDRRVTVRPAPDTMSYLTGFLPAEQGIAVHTALTRHADSLRARGDTRSRGQIMADTLVERVTGQTRATGSPAEIQLVMTDGALLGQDSTPARLAGYGPLPAAVARAVLRASADATKGAQVWVRRLYTSPTDGELVAMDSRRRFFPAGIRRFLVVRDEVCRNAWCDAPIRHVDHPVPVADGGETSVDNGQGLCELCNQAKEAPGWSATPTRAGRRTAQTVTVTTPTGHSYTTRAPDPPGNRRSLLAELRSVGPPRPSAAERHLATVLQPYDDPHARAG